MKGEYLLDAIECVDDDIIDKTKIIKRFKKKHTWTWVFVVAIVIAAAVLLFYFLKNYKDTELTYINENLPKIKLSFGVEGLSFEGLMFYDISERDDGNPWTADANLESLPVYKNLAYTDAFGTPVYLSEAEMVSYAKDMAKELETEINDIGTHVVDYTAQPDSLVKKGSAYGITATTPLGKIRVYGNGKVCVSLNESAKLSSKYNFKSSNISDEEAKKTILILLEQYPGVTNFKSPEVSIWGDYTFSGEKLGCFSAFDGAGDITKQILNFNFNQISLDIDYNGQFSGFKIKNSLSAAEKLGEYPIITPQEAQQLYHEGKYITTVSSDYERKDEIAKFELIYRTGNGEETFMPYYRFYVELLNFKAKNQISGLKCYGAFYVPAIKSEYLI